MELLNNPELWEAIVLILTVAGIIWGVAAYKTKQPPQVTEIGHTVIDTMQDFAEKKAEELKQKKQDVTNELIEINNDIVVETKKRGRPKKATTNETDYYSGA